MNWFTIVAQIVNFLILVFLLKHFLYDRIIQAMDEREKKIQNRLDEAKRKSNEAASEAESYRKKQREWENERQEMMVEAKKKAEAERQSLIEKAREETDSLRRRWQTSVQKEKDSFLKGLRDLMGQQVYAITRRTLTDLADTDTETQVADVFLARLKNLPSKQKTRIGKAIRSRENSATILSAFELSPGNRQKITRAIREELADEAELTYEIDTDLVMGIEVKGHGEKLAWSVRQYLKGLETDAKRLLEAKTSSEG
ncbi:MAG: F0F1 ATP synthase subunit B [Deltaproteobacteria bacterium]|nr:F0F1 ATP synthase subunit B [Deltaproteobacteria bacterium]